MMKLLLMRVLQPVVGRFPHAFYRLAVPVGWIAYQVRPGLRRNVIRNMLPLCDGDVTRAKGEAVRAFQHVAMYYVDLASLPRRKMASFESEHLMINGAENLSALEAGSAVIVSAHTGNAELAVQALTFRGRDFVALVEALHPQRLSDYVLRLRSSAGGKFCEADFGGLRACLAALKSGRLLGLMGDRDIQGSGICTELAGRHVKLPRGPWDLARRTGAPVLPVFCTRIRHDDFQVEVAEPMAVDGGQEEGAGIREAMGRYAALLEAHLRRNPGQWAVLEDFWRVHACSEPSCG